ncbi:expressed unknown protein [Seminavis robusta]|uniref:Uncharacterized protein n=1 Tax=Seminavis robusta TaxID=568900 RepID=A0A9N8HE74_9STRA|nr:expressed unknown protein [Seminavis robusta]|eukprot:Sro391_g133220.1 n/a (317) ;mRNA; r:64440-65524
MSTRAVSVAENAAFRKLCERIQRNDEALKLIILIFDPDIYGEEEFAALIAALENNKTIEVARFSFRGLLPPTQVQKLGSFFCHNTTIEELSVHAVANSKHCGEEGVSALVTQLSHNKKALCANLKFTKCAFETVEDKRLVAWALGESASLEGFVLLDKDGLDKETATMYGHAIAANNDIVRVAFYGLHEDALPVITRAMDQNHYLTAAVVSGEKMEGDMAQKCEKEVAHSIAMNKAGRCFLEDSIDRPHDSSIEEFWLAALAKHINDHPVVYSWILDYPDIFLRVVGTGVQQESKWKRKAGLDHKPPTSKKPKTMA